MKIFKLIEKEFDFLVKEYGYTYSHDYEGELYHQCSFQKENQYITLSYDSKWDYLDFAINVGKEFFVKTSYFNVSWGDRVSVDYQFESEIRSMYSFNKNQIFLSPQQFKSLVCLYSRFVKSIMMS